MALADSTDGRVERGQVPLLYPVLAGLCLAGFLGSLTTGPADIGSLEAVRALIFETDGPETDILRQIRLPRAVLGAMVGATLGLTGAAMQGLLRNPLAEPGLLGVSSFAALGAVIALQTGLAATFALALPLAALSGAALSVILLVLLAGSRGSSLTLILAGIAISALGGALTTLVLNLSPNPFAAAEIVFWMMGSLADRSWTHVLLALPFMVIGWTALIATRRGLDALTLGEDAAASLGINLTVLRGLVVVGAAAAIGAATAVTGAVGFVGLIVPHILRPFVGGAPGRLLFASALGGAAMVLLADTAVDLILPERDLKLGVLTALVGAPVFLHLVYKTRRAGL